MAGLGLHLERRARTRGDRLAELLADYAVQTGAQFAVLADRIEPVLRAEHSDTAECKALDELREVCLRSREALQVADDKDLELTRFGPRNRAFQLWSVAKSRAGYSRVAVGGDDPTLVTLCTLGGDRDLLRDSSLAALALLIGGESGIDRGSHFDLLAAPFFFAL